MTGMPQRYAIRYATERWKDTRWFIGYLVVILIAFSLFFHPAGQSLVTSLIPIAEAIVIAGAYLGYHYFLRRRSYLEVGGEGIRLRYGLTVVDMPYTAISRVRRQPLDVAFASPERRRYRNRFTRRLGREPAVYIRVDRRQEELVAQLEKRLGARYVLGHDIVLPIDDPDDFLNAVKSRLRGR